MDECPLLDLQPVLRSSDERTIEENNRRIIEWTRRMCQYVDELRARVAVLEAGP